MPYEAILTGETHSSQRLGSKCSFVISLSFLEQKKRNSEDEKEKNIATIYRLNTAFDKTNVIISDTLNRHNASIYFPNDDPESKSFELGTIWKKSVFHDQLVANGFEINRWEIFLKDENFKLLLDNIRNTYEVNPEFFTIVDFVCSKFLAFICEKRKKIAEQKLPLNNVGSSDFKMDQSLKNCVDYVLEECAITQLLRTKGYDSLFHLGKVNQAVEWAAKNNIFLKDNPELEKTVNSNPLKIFIISKYNELKCNKSESSTKISMKNGDCYINKFGMFNAEGKTSINSLPQEGQSYLQLQKM